MSSQHNLEKKGEGPKKGVEIRAPDCTYIYSEHGPGGTARPLITVQNMYSPLSPPPKLAHEAEPGLFSMYTFLSDLTI